MIRGCGETLRMPLARGETLGEGRWEALDRGSLWLAAVGARGEGGVR